MLHLFTHGSVVGNKKRGLFVPLFHSVEVWFGVIHKQLFMENESVYFKVQCVLGKT